MTSRYNTRRVGVNDSSQYKKLFKDRGVKKIEQYFTPQMQHLTADQIASLGTISHVWGTGDRFYKLAFDYYNDSRLWWVIAWFNRTPTEADLKLGDTIFIPTPVNRVIEMLGL